MKETREEQEESYAHFPGHWDEFRPLSEQLFPI